MCMGCLRKRISIEGVPTLSLCGKVGRLSEDSFMGNKSSVDVLS